MAICSSLHSPLEQSDVALSHRPETWVQVCLWVACRASEDYYYADRSSERGFVGAGQPCPASHGE